MLINVNYSLSDKNTYCTCYSTTVLINIHTSYDKQKRAERPKFDSTSGKTSASGAGGIWIQIPNRLIAGLHDQNKSRLFSSQSELFKLL